MINCGVSIAEEWWQTWTAAVAETARIRCVEVPATLLADEHCGLQQRLRRYGLQPTFARQLMPAAVAAHLDRANQGIRNEALALVRLGRAAVKGQGFVGLSLPVYGDGSTGVQMPLVLGAGIVWDG